MGNNKLFGAILSLSLVLLTWLPSSAGETAERGALQAADAWLKLSDKGDYSGSWETAAELFRNAITREQWSQALNAARKPLGKVIKRSVKSEQYATSLPGAPDGEYVVIQYETSFENKKSSVETVTPMRENDGTWRVSGYYIK